MDLVNNIINEYLLNIYLNIYLINNINNIDI